MTRLVAGSAKGRTLKIPPRLTRPTSSRVREAIFSHLEAGGVIDGARVADIFAGSGALGLEALSRGGAQGVFIDNGPGVAKIIRKNAAVCGFATQVQVLPLGATAGLEQLRQDFDLAFLDPPYDYSNQKLATILEVLTTRLAANATVVLERAKRLSQTQWPANLECYSEKVYGDTVVQYAVFTD